MLLTLWIALNLCISYLDNRSQCVHIADESSNPVCLNYSVPQESGLGPLWFVLYTTPVRDILSTTSKIITMLMTFNSTFLLTPTQSLPMLTSQHSNNVLARFTSGWNAISWNRMMIKPKTLIGSKQQLNKISVRSIQIGSDSLVQPVQKVKN